MWQWIPGNVDIYLNDQRSGWENTFGYLNGEGTTKARKHQSTSATNNIKDSSSDPEKKKKPRNRGKGKFFSRNNSWNLNDGIVKSENLDYAMSPPRVREEIFILPLHHPPS